LTARPRCAAFSSACRRGAGVDRLGIFDGPTDLASALAIASWHATAVRVPLNEDCWLGINGVSPLYGGAVYQAAIVAYVATLHAAGLYAIVDLHWNAPGKVVAASQQPLPDADHAVDFWRSVAAVFAPDPATVFDLYNEPFLFNTYTANPSQDLWACWLDGCDLISTSPEGPPTLRRTTGPQWHAVARLDRARDGRKERLDGRRPQLGERRERVARAPAEGPRGRARGVLAQLPGRVLRHADVLGRDRGARGRQGPRGHGEVGDSVCSAGSYAATLLPWADAHGMSYLGWTWNTWGDCDNILISDYDGTPTGNFGATFQSHMKGLAPDPSRRGRG